MAGRRRRSYISAMALLPRAIDLINRTVRLTGVRITRGVAYGKHGRQLMDIYAPKGVNLPVIVFFYGGSWQWGDRADYPFVAGLLAAQGFVVAVPDYGKYPQCRYPEFVEDCTAAVRWVAANIRDYAGEADEIFLMGHSAGAYNAAMVALAPDAPKLAGVIGLAGPYDFLPIKDPVIREIFRPAPELEHTQPIHYAHGEAPPMLLMTGAADRKVLPRNTTALAAELRAAGAVVETRIYPKLGHIGILSGLLPYFAWRGPVLRDVLAFCAACRAGEFTSDGSETSGSMIRRPL